MAQFSAPTSLPANSAFLRVSAIGRNLVPDRVGIEFEGAVVQDADQAGPVREGVADVLGQLGFLRDTGELGLQPGLERGDDRGGLLASGGEADGRILAAHGLLDPVEGRELAQHLLGDGGALVLEARHEAAADMGPAMDQFPRATVARSISVSAV